MMFNMIRKFVFRIFTFSVNLPTSLPVTALRVTRYIFVMVICGEERGGESLL